MQQTPYEELLMKAFSEGALSVEYKRYTPSQPLENAECLVLYANIGAVRTRLSSIALNDRNISGHQI